MAEKAANSRPKNGLSLLAAVLGLIVLFPLGYHVVFRVATLAAEPEEFYEFPREMGTDCDGRDVRYMRYEHWEYLKTVREEIVRCGKRDGTPGLGTCQDCHKSNERFCNRCHAAASVKPDCFDCHDYP